jgi:hypothetical protein
LHHALDAGDLTLCAAGRPINDDRVLADAPLSQHSDDALLAGRQIETPTPQGRRSEVVEADDT